MTDDRSYSSQYDTLSRVLIGPQPFRPGELPVLLVFNDDDGSTQIVGAASGNDWFVFDNQALADRRRGGGWVEIRIPCPPRHDYATVPGRSPGLG